MEDILEIPKIDVEQVMEQIRENVRKRRQEFPPSKATSSLPTDQEVADLTSLHRNHEIYPLRFISHRRVLGHFVVLAKKLLQQLLTPILERQLAFNTATARLTSSLWKQVATLYQQQETALQALQEQLWGGAHQHSDALQALRAEMVALGQAQSDALQALRAQVAAGQQQQAALQAEVATLGQRQDDALQALRAEVSAQVGAGQQQQAALQAEVATLGQRQDDALQALRAEVSAQVGAGQQQQAALQAEVATLGQRQDDALQALRAEVSAQVGASQQQAALQAEVVTLGQRQDDALQALRAEVSAQVGASQQQAALQAEVVTLGQRQDDALQALRAEVSAQVGAGQQQQAALQAEVATLGQRQDDALQALRAEVEKGAVDRDARMVEGERTIAQLKTEGILQERRITLLLEEARKRLPAAWDQAQLQRVADEANHALDAFYVSFEDQFRGTRADIKERLRVYLPILQQAQLGSETAPLLDVGCGRGEWLELLQEAGLQGQGVDCNRVLVEQCQQRGLGVVEGDWLAYLRSVPDASLGAVTGFHIIEHLPLDVLIKLLDETVRVLMSGGVAIFETPNPQNVLVGSHNFYIDPTHRNPLPSVAMQFMAEARGLCRVKIIELHPYPAAFHVQETHLEVAQRFNAYFYGPQDYGVVGWKA